jgi:hypothetical protein
VRAVGVLLLFVGLIASVVGFFSGCGTLFTWNGRHVIDVQTLPDDVAYSKTFVPEPGRRYTLAIHVVFDRETAPKVDGSAKPEVKMSVVARVKDSVGTKLADVTGWVDPNEPPNVLYGQAVPDSVTVARGDQAPELFVERLIGPFSSASAAPLVIEVNLGPDRIGSQRILHRRLVLHDDAIPSSIRNAFILGSGGVALFLTGFILGFLGWWKRRKPRNPLKEATRSRNPLKEATR